MKLDLKNFITENESLKNKNRILKEQLLKQDTFSRRNNLKIQGLIMTNYEKIEEAVCRAITDAGINLSQRDIERVHYQGPFEKGQP